MPKQCSTCNIEKPYTDFYVGKNRCKECIRTERKPRKNREPRKLNTPTQLNNYVNYMTHDLNGSDY